MSAFAVLLLAVGIVAGCSSSPGPESRVNAPLVEEPYRLSADREAFAKIREQVPEETRIANDEKAFVQQLLADPEQPPSRVREKFNSALAKKRREMNKDLEKRRTEFVRKERKDREEFQKAQTAERATIKNKKLSADERKDFFNGIEQRRKDFYTGQREARDAFEADIRDRRKNFEDYTREISSDFAQEHRNFTLRHNEWKKAKEDKRKADRAALQERTKQVEDEFKKMDSVPAEPLGTGQ